MNKVTKIIRTYQKSRELRDRDEELFDDAYNKAYDELKVELDRVPNDRETTDRAYKNLSLRK